MHHIYTTRAIIIKSLPHGEANKIYFLLTKDLGFIRASAQGVRLDKSKLKGHLEDFSVISLSAVRGKEIWRVTSAETICRSTFLKNPEKLSIAKNIFSLLLRLLAGEEKNEILFNCIDSFFIFLAEQQLSVKQLKNLEILTVLRVLHHLGYLKESSDLSPFVSDDALSEEFLAEVNEKMRIALYQINEALNNTNL